LPSTILGIIRFMENINLDRNNVEKDSLFGIGTLIDMLSKGMTDNIALIEGPVIKVRNTLAFHIQFKDEVSLIKIDDEVLDIIGDDLVIPSSARIGKVVPRIEVGIVLKDSIKGIINRTVAPNHCN